MKLMWAFGLCERSLSRSKPSGIVAAGWWVGDCVVDGTLRRHEVKGLPDLWETRRKRAYVRDFRDGISTNFGPGFVNID